MTNSESSTAGWHSDSFLEWESFWSPKALPNLTVFQVAKCRKHLALLLKASDALLQKSMIMLSMDGQNTSWKVYENLKFHRTEKEFLLGRVDYMWCTEPFRLTWKSAGKWKKIKNHVEAVQRFLNSKRTVNWIEHFRCFSIDVLADTLGWGWTHWVEDEHPSNGSLGKCCECLKASSNLTQIRTT